ncbi:GNAT family N-acetyltransferase [Marinobacter lipolyticus]|uniref:GNAT family N-acetyltransferase n=1 Tax=Marinobacter lipolyticus TaxID=209639 RepID=UPI001BCB4BBF|nr:GNAT family N-acyltransferase [Marinobacter lipolyticus]MBS8239398.1 GNAT family N-acetyltransferase [Marinobacter lipolyticus]
MSAQSVPATRPTRKLKAGITNDPATVEAAQRLRYRVFSEEYDSDLGADTPGIDADNFDRHCDHLVVTDETTGALVATTRVLHQNKVARTGGFYSEGEFELDAFYQLSGNIAELGRTCVHPEYRNGATITLLWATLAEYLVKHDVQYLIGCASISMADGGLKAWNIARYLQREFMADQAFRVTPRRELPHLAHPVAVDRPVDVPALIRAYMRLGARVCGEPCWDPEFRCADVLVVLEVSRLASRYSRHFMGRV